MYPLNRWQSAGVHKFPNDLEELSPKRGYLQTNDRLVWHLSTQQLVDLQERQLE
jgi:hypothetical protein